VAVARRFAADAGLRLELVRFAWPDLVPDLAAGRFDLAMGGVTMRPERAIAGRFTRPVAETGAVVLARRGMAATMADVDRGAFRLAVNHGGHLEHVARRLFPHAMLLLAPGNAALPALLDAGAADAVLTDDAEARGFAGAAGPVVLLGPFTRDRKAYLGRDAALVARLDGWLRAREVDGTLARLRETWLPGGRGTRRSGFRSDLDALLADIDLRLAFMPAIAAAKAAARRPVADPAQEARVLDAVRAEAAAHEVDVDAIAGLFAAQLAAARAAQAAFLATPAAERPPVDPLDLEREARPALARLSAEIVARAAAVARDPALAAVDRERLADALDASLAGPADRRAIAAAILRLAAAGDAGRPLARAGRPLASPCLPGVRAATMPPACARSPSSGSSSPPASPRPGMPASPAPPS
jgi:cyclohexadienyl dehydratase